MKKLSKQLCLQIDNYDEKKLNFIISQLSTISSGLDDIWDEYVFYSLMNFALNSEVCISYILQHCSCFYSYTKKQKIETISIYIQTLSHLKKTSWVEDTLSQEQITEQLLYDIIHINDLPYSEHEAIWKKILYKDLLEWTKNPLYILSTQLRTTQHLQVLMLLCYNKHYAIVKDKPIKLSERELSERG